MEPLQKGAYIAVITACILFIIAVANVFGYFNLNSIGVYSSELPLPKIQKLPVGEGFVGVSIYGGLIFLYVRYESLKKDYEGISKDISYIKKDMRDMRNDVKDDIKDLRQDIKSLLEVGRRK